MMKVLVGLVYITIMSGCSFTASIVDMDSALEGSVPFYPSVAQKVSSQCSPAKVDLHHLDANGTVSSALLAETSLGDDGRFIFSEVKQNGIDQTVTSTHFILEATICGEKYFRPVTGLKNQDITIASTFLSLFSADPTAQALKLTSVDPKDIEAVIATLSAVEGASLQETYDRLIDDSSKSQMVESVFQVPLSQLMDIRPNLATESVPLTLGEAVTGQFSVVGNVWHSGYPLAYEWLVEDTVVSRNSQFQWDVPKNAKSVYEVTARIGQERGDGTLNQDKPYLTRNYLLNITNTHPAVVPPVNLVSASPTSSSSVSLRFDTGVGLANCGSFSSLAITEDSPLPPLSAEFSHICTNEGTQDLTYVLSPGEGLRTLRVWAKDAEGRISSLAEHETILLDTTSPAVSIDNLSKSLFRGGESVTIQFASEDATSGLASVILQYSVDGVSFTDVAAVQGQASHAWLLPAGSTSQAQFRILAIDAVGLSSQAVTSSFEVDGVAPAAPILARTSSSPSNHNLVTMNVQCSADTEKILFSEQVVDPSLTDGGWETCPDIKNVSVSGGDGTKTIRAWSRDLAGNISAAASISMELDTSPTSAPSVTLTTAILTNNSTLGFALASCAGIDKILFKEDVLAPSPGDPAWIDCSLNQSYMVAGEGLHSLHVWAKNLAGTVSSTYGTVQMSLDTQPPSLVLSSFHGGLYRGGVSEDVVWTASDVNFGPNPIKLEYSADNGSTWSVMAGATPNASPFGWTLPLLNSAEMILRLTASDLAGNSTSVSSTTAFTLDSTSPTAPGLSLASPAVTKLAIASLTVNCDPDFYQILFKQTNTAPSLQDSGWETCSVNKDFNLIGGDGTIGIYAWTRDHAGNISSASDPVSVLLDRASPAMTLLSMTGGDYAGGSAQVLSWAATDLSFSTTPIYIEYSSDGGSSWQAIGGGYFENGATNCSLADGASGCLSWILPSIDQDQMRVRLTAGDLAGNTATTVTGASFTIVTTPPVVDALTITEGASTINKNIRVNFAASGVTSLLSHFCFKYTAGAVDLPKPASEDACWIPVNAPNPGVSPSLNISFNNYYISLGLTGANYRVYGWVKNKAGVISETANYATIEYIMQPPPTVTNVVAANIDGHQTPPAPSELVTPQGSSVYVKWKATTMLSIPAGAIKIYYTLDEISYMLLAENLSNGVNGDCNVDGVNYTGCAVVTASSSTFFKIRVSVGDSIGQVTLASASPNNLNNFRILAGNTEPGMGGSASAAMFNFGTAPTSGQPGAIILAEDGTFFVRNSGVGIVRIAPATGIAEVYIPYTGVHTNGPIGTATLRRNQTFMSIDYANNLILYDYNLIRKVDLASNQVSTLIGGGSTKASGVLASEYQLGACGTYDRCPVIPLPNGDIWFMDNPGEKKIWHYKASDQRVYSISLSGTGMTGRPVGDDVSSSSYSFLSFQMEFDVTTSQVKTIIAQFKPEPCVACGVSSFSAFIDPATGQTINTPATPGHNGNSNFKPTITARNGKIYAVVVESAKTLLEYDSTSNTWTHIFGSGTQGFCEDGTDAGSCDSMIMDAFVTLDRRVFFTDNGLVRTIDGEGKVRTLFGQRANFGDGGLALSARIHSARYFDFTSTGDIVFLDGIENEIRRFTIGGTIRHVAGNGKSSYATSGDVAATAPISGSWWGGHMQLLVDPLTDDIYVGQHYIMKISNEATPIITRVVGGGATIYAMADNLPGLSVGVGGNERSELIGIRDRKLLVTLSVRNGSNANHRCYAKEYDISDSYRQSHFAGNENLCSDVTPDVGVATATADVGNTSSNRHLRAHWDGDLNAWIIPKATSTTLRAYVGGGNIEGVLPGTFAEPIQSLAVVKNASNQKVIYYCGSTSQKIFRYNLSTGQQSALTWPTTQYACSQGVLIYNQARGSVVFSFTHNDMVSFAEIVDIP